MTSTSAPVHVQVDRCLFLLGRPPLGEYLVFVKHETIHDQPFDAASLAQQWRDAAARVNHLAMIEHGAADNPKTPPLPDDLAAYASEVLDDPITRETFGVAPSEIRMVPLDDLVVFQKRINLSYAEQLAAALGPDPTDADVIRFALPIDGRYDATPNAGQIGAGPLGAQWAVVSPSNDLRQLGHAIVDPSQVSGVSFGGRATHVVVAAVGYGANLLSAMRVGSRLILKNGSHRAYALRSAGYTHAPVLIEHIPPGEEGEHLPPDVLQQPDLYLAHPRPPMLRDYFDGDLHTVMRVARKARQVRVTVQYEPGFVLGV